MAERLEDGHNEFNTEFGPVNVRLYEIAVAVELEAITPEQIRGHDLVRQLAPACSP